ncbi:MAG: hypothetical protein AAF514_12705, partial [Verrucomicrobiota bacterium]
DTARHGFFEPGSVIRITAPENRDGKPFLKWAGATGKFADPGKRTAVYTTPASDVQLMPIYGPGPVKLTVLGGTATPADPQPGDPVTITTDLEKRFSHWTTEEGVGIHLPHQRSFTFTMPSRDVTFTAKGQALP